MKFSRVQIEFLDFVLQNAADRLQILNRGKHDQQLLNNDGSADVLDIEKLENDVSFTRDVLLETLEELRTKGSLHNLTKLFKMIAAAEDYERQMLQTNAMLNSKSVSLDVKISQKTKEFEELTEYLKNRKDDLDHEYESMARAGRWNEKIIIKVKAIERAEKVKQKQEAVDSAIADIKRNEDHTETDNFLNEMFIHAFVENQLIQLEEQIEQWSAKYDNDLEVNTTKVKDTKEEIQNLSSENEEMVALIAKREQEMEKFLAIKAKREADEAAEKRIYDSATTIQAWWRGVMVRRKLGPYRKKKRKKQQLKPAASAKKK